MKLSFGKTHRVGNCIHGNYLVAIREDYVSPRKEGSHGQNAISFKRIVVVKNALPAYSFLWSS